MHDFNFFSRNSSSKFLVKPRQVTSPLGFMYAAFSIEKHFKKLCSDKLQLIGFYLIYESRWVRLCKHCIVYRSFHGLKLIHCSFFPQLQEFRYTKTTQILDSKRSILIARRDLVLARKSFIFLWLNFISFR